jgi:hypothetical protein
MDFAKRVQARISVEMVKRQKARGAVEWTDGRLVDRALQQADASGEWHNRFAGQVEHCRRRIDTGKIPPGLGRCQGLGFHSPARADDKYIARSACLFSKQQHDHAMKVSQSRYLVRGIVSVGSDGS